MEPGTVFSSLDGREVLPFQAVVRKAVWPKLWLTLEPVFKNRLQLIADIMEVQVLQASKLM